MQKYFLLIFLGVLSACNQASDQQSPPAAMGDTVFVHYVGKVVDGDVFESTMDGEPRGIVVGQHETLPAFENALIGMRAGESKTVTLPPEQAFGEYRDEPGMIQTIERATLAHSIEPRVGAMLNAAVFLPDQPQDQSSIVPVVISAVTDQTITVDANHPLAGKTLSLDVTVVAIRPADHP